MPPLSPLTETTIPWSTFDEAIESSQKFILSSHLRPDADALGSELGMASLLRQKGKEVTIVNPGASPAHLKFLDPENEIKCIADMKSGWSNSYDTWLVIDTSSWQQLGDIGTLMQKFAGKKIVVDHHVSSDKLDAIEFKDTKSPASGCLVFEYATHANLKLDPQTAMQLFSAICTDTGWFRFPATNSNTYRIAAELIDAGVDQSTLHKELYERGSLGKLHLSGAALSRVEVGCDGLLAYTYVSQDDFKKIKAHPADTENLVNECLKIDGVEVALILVEQQNRQVKISFRSRGRFNVAKIAEEFGGGGHILASGGMVPGPIVQAVSGVISRITAIMKAEQA